jgi:glc operon protein GlcG
MSIIRTRTIINDAGAADVLDAAVREARAREARVVIAVVDPWGEVIALRRTDGAQAASSRVAVDKARTAAIFVRPTVGGEVVGAIGTSGETPDEDEAISIAGAAAAFATAATPALTYEGARHVAEAAAAEAAARGVAPVISAVDAGGALMFLVRPDLAQVASVEVTTDKARTAAIYRRPSKDFEDQAANGRPSALHLARAVPLQGGVPITSDGVVVGAIGVSGARSADEDNELAHIGAQAMSTAAVQVGA